MSTTKDSANENAQEGKAVIKVLAVVLDRLVGANSHLTEEEKGQVTKFHALKAPVIAIGPYLERWMYYPSRIFGQNQASVFEKPGSAKSSC